MSKPLGSILGDTPGRVIIKLLILSLLLGIVMSLFGVSPFNLFWAIYNFFIKLWSMGFSAFRHLFDVILTGAAIVVPVFIIMRLLDGHK